MNLKLWMIWYEFESCEWYELKVINDMSFENYEWWFFYNKNIENLIEFILNIYFS